MTSELVLLTLSVSLPSSALQRQARVCLLVSLCSHPKLMFLGDGGNTLVWAAGLVEGVTDDPAAQWSLLGEDTVLPGETCPSHKAGALLGVE